MQNVNKMSLYAQNLV